MSDALTYGRKLLRVFNVIDDCDREALAIEAGLSYPARAVVETLECLKEEIGVPKYVRCDNGLGFIPKTFMNWCKKNFREDILDAYYFNGTHQLQKISDNWKEDYNFNHPHKSLGNKSPKEYMPRFDEGFKSFIKSDLDNNYLSNFKVS